MTSTWLVLALAFGLVAAAAGVLFLGARGDARGEGGPAGPPGRRKSAERPPPEPPEDDAAT